MRKKIFIRSLYLGFIKRDFLLSPPADHLLVVSIEEERLSALIHMEMFLGLVTDQPGVTRQSSQVTLLLRKAQIPLFAWHPTRLNMGHVISHSKTFFEIHSLNVSTPNQISTFKQSLQSQNNCKVPPH